MKILYLFTGGSRLYRNDKTIMLVGATGSGKSTLINGLANYLFEVNWEDDFRFTLVNLEQEEKNAKKIRLSFSPFIKVVQIHL